MPLAKPAVLAMLAAASTAMAQDIDLGARVAEGKWALAYQRTAEFKPLRLKKNENGISHTCIAGDARAKIVDWVSGKGCTIEHESMQDGIYQLDGQCRLKWWRSHAIPVRVQLRPETPERFRLDIETLNDSVLGFTEHTTATREGPCEPNSEAVRENKK